MITFLKKNIHFFGICCLTFLIYYPSLFVFFTNDDFFFLKISRSKSIWEFLNFFNFVNGPDGFGVYRPLTTQVFYMLQNPILMHAVVFIVFFLLLYTIYILAIKLFKNIELALIATFLYAVSATHFAHFYYLATFQELGMTLCVIGMLIFYIDKKYLLSSCLLTLALMSKETAVVAPFLIILVDWHTKSVINYKKYLRYFFILGIYLVFHFFIYGLAKGDSYVWDFSIRKALNSIAWYLVWALNLPETLVDFVGPRLSINPNLFIYWSNVIYPILALFSLQLSFIAYLMQKKLNDLDNKKNSLFVIVWFVVSLLPVIFLPQHKFTFYLTLPLIAIVYRISFLIVQNRSKPVVTIFFLIIWTALSILTTKHSINTSWITNGEKISRKVFNYFDTNHLDKTKISFVDTPSDIDLPWSPTVVVKNALSDKNFFYVYFPEAVDKVYYGEKDGSYPIVSREFLGY